MRPTPRQPPSPGTRNMRKVIVHQFYVFAARYTCYDGYGRPYKLYQGDNPAAGIRGVQLEYRPYYLSEEELVRFFAAIDRETVIGLRDYAYFLTLFLTARRRAEIAKDRKSTRLNSSHQIISYAVFCLKKKKQTNILHLYAARLR